MNVVKHYEFKNVSIFVEHVKTDTKRMRIVVFSLSGRFTDQVTLDYHPVNGKRLDVLVGVLTAYGVPEKDTIRVAQEIERIGNSLCIK